MLESLVLNSPPHKLLDGQLFSGLSALKYLCLSNLKNLNGLRFLRGSSVKSLLVCYCRNVSLKGISHLNLDALEIANCKCVDRWNEVLEVQSLKTLKLIESIKVKSVDSLCALKNLEVLVVLGSSYFENGNLDAARGRYRHFGFDNKRHYNIRYDEFKKKYLRE